MELRYLTLEAAQTMDPVSWIRHLMPYFFLEEITARKSSDIADGEGWAIRIDSGSREALTGRMLITTKRDYVSMSLSKFGTPSGTERWYLFNVHSGYAEVQCAKGKYSPYIFSMRIYPDFVCGAARDICAVALSNLPVGILAHEDPEFPGKIPYQKSIYVSPDFDSDPVSQLKRHYEFKGIPFVLNHEVPIKFM